MDNIIASVPLNEAKIDKNARNTTDFNFNFPLNHKDLKTEKPILYGIIESDKLNLYEAKKDTFELESIHKIVIVIDQKWKLSNVAGIVEISVKTVKDENAKINHSLYYGNEKLGKAFSNDSYYGNSLRKKVASYQSIIDDISPNQFMFRSVGSTEINTFNSKLFGGEQATSEQINHFNTIKNGTNSEMGKIVNPELTQLLVNYKQEDPSDNNKSIFWKEAQDYVIKYAGNIEKGLKAYNENMASYNLVHALVNDGNINSKLYVQKAIEAVKFDPQALNKPVPEFTSIKNAALYTPLEFAAKYQKTEFLEKAMKENLIAIKNPQNILSVAIEYNALKTIESIVKNFPHLVTEEHARTINKNLQPEVYSKLEPAFIKNGFIEKPKNVFGMRI